MYATQFHDEFKGYRYLRDFYEIALESGAVRARYMAEPQGNAARIYTPFDGDGPQPAEPAGGPFVTPVETPLNVMTLKDVNTLAGVVGAAIKFREEAEEVRFPHALLSLEEKKKLWQWGQTSNWRFIDHEEEGITLTRRPIDEELLWSP